eukprot:TRINITY_DN1845_c0_g1_i1.p1 TRINITY_DN1845_c0_g1~~TRINITY_DN1845_c0_g1_i1.p1  ORF type:complete len:133 (+),score=27.93 TRINITY_DN1845_c0_g1_i1:281-679(+)
MTERKNETRALTVDLIERLCLLVLKDDTIGSRVMELISGDYQQLFQERSQLLRECERLRKQVDDLTEENALLRKNVSQFEQVEKQTQSVQSALETELQRASEENVALHLELSKLKVALPSKNRVFRDPKLRA